jgi:hypothetical protein
LEKLKPLEKGADLRAGIGSSDSVKLSIEISVLLHDIKTKKNVNNKKNFIKTLQKPFEISNV